MEFEITYRELAEMSTSLNRLVQVNMPAKYAFRLQKTMKTLQQELKDLNEHKETLIKKYGEEVDNEKGRSIQVKTEHAETFWNEWNEILEDTITITANPIPLSLIEDSEVTIADMALLERFIDDDLSNDSEPVREVTETAS